MDNKVTSEIYNEFDYTSPLKPIINTESKFKILTCKFINNFIITNLTSDVVSKFRFKCPPKKPLTDKDGDIIVCRKPKKENYRIIQIGKIYLGT